MYIERVVYNKLAKNFVIRMEEAKREGRDQKEMYTRYFRN